MIRTLSDVQHVLHRPGMYTGCDTGSITTSEWRLNAECVWETWSCNQIVRKCIDEILSNAIDNTISNSLASSIEIKIDRDSICVINDGFPLKVDTLSQCGSNAIMQAFGKLRTSSHYDNKDSTAGTFGIGCKIANIFSTLFEVEVVDIDGNEVAFTWKDHMSTCEQGQVADTNLPAGSIKIRFLPDQSVTGGFDDLSSYVSWVQHRCLEASTFTSVEFIINGTVIQDTSPHDFVRYHIKGDAEIVNIADGTYVCMLSEPMLDAASSISLVNGHRTGNHGVHVDRALAEIHQHMHGKRISSSVFNRVMREHVFMFVSCTVKNPIFPSQSKDRLVGGSLKLPQILKSAQVTQFFEDLHARIEMEALMKLPKLTRKQSVKVDKLQDAVMAGSKQSEQCTLILTEGDSAKTFAMSGLSIIGHDFFGVFPLRGKALNVRDETDEKIMSNVEWKSVMSILGLSLDSFSMTALRYGRVMILADADLDGIHIAGLIINFFESKFPNIFKHIPDFVQLFKTPVVKAKYNQQVHEFFTMHEFRQTDVPKSASIHYYKGLGSSTRNEAREYFQRRSELTRTCTITDSDDHAMLTTMFGKSNANTRKQLIRDHIIAPMNSLSGKTVSAADFVKSELLYFSAYDVARSIPNIMDGLKTSQRKVIYIAKDIKEVKVAQLASTVALKTSYLHGEQSLADCIITLAQDFVGSNNHPLLKGIGQFGSRLQGGKDAASPRYVHVQPSPFMKAVIMREDDHILHYLEEEGVTVEPNYFLPLIPLVLINGARGIATGFSTFIPCHSLKSVVNAVQDCINKQPMREIEVAYNHFNGTIVDDEKGCVTHGKMRAHGGKLIITELPVYTWTESFISKLESCKHITKVVSRCDDVSVHIEIKTDDTAAVQKMLTSQLSTKNMFLFDANGILQPFESAHQIVEQFVQVRLEFYMKRIQYELGVLTKKLEDMKHIETFIATIINSGVQTFVDDPNAYLVKHELPLTLLKMPISDLCHAKLKKIRDNIEACNRDIETNRQLTPEGVYLGDIQSLNVFL